MNRKIWVVVQGQYSDREVLFIDMTGWEDLDPLWLNKIGDRNNPEHYDSFEVFAFTEEIEWLHGIGLKPFEKWAEEWYGHSLALAFRDPQTPERLRPLLEKRYNEEN